MYSEEGEVDERAITLQDILVFVTGADHIPPMGFEKQLTWSFDSESIFPLSSTCSMTLYLPTKHQHYDTFKFNIVEGLVNGFDFGKP